MTKICEWSDCLKPVRASGLCGMHYERRRKGAEMDSPSRGKGPVRERFWPKVDRTSFCWLWKASRNSAGYGLVGVGTTSQLAHRVAWELERGPIPKGMSLDHRCLVRECVNPAHLRLATHATNNQNRAGATKASKSGIRGVRYRADIGRWEARGGLQGRLYTIGHYETAEAAHDAASNWRREHMPFSEMDKKKEAKS